MEIDYGSTGKGIRYGISFLYKMETVANADFPFSKFTFKIWDYYNDFKIDDNQLTLKITLVNIKLYIIKKS